MISLCLHLESNQDLFLRTELFYPLNYEDIVSYYTQKTLSGLLLFSYFISSASFIKSSLKPTIIPYPSTSMTGTPI